MINMNTQKRVSFGSYGSMVETWVIEDFPEHQTEPEDNFFKNLVNTANIKESSEKIQESVRICDLDDLVNDVPIIKKENPQPSLESRDNPFKPDGELCKEAEDILKRATIVRDTFILNDNQEKDTSKISKDNSNGAQPVLEESLTQTKVNESQSSPVSIQPKQNGVEDKNVSPESVKLEVEPNVVNDVNFKDKKKQKKCCSVM